MLSRHLYEIDEVVSALMWACKRRRLIEVAFWCQELLDTEEIDKLYEALYTYWLWQIGVCRLDLLLELERIFHSHEETTSTEILQLCLSFAMVSPQEKDNSVFVLLVMGSHDSAPWDRVSITTKKYEVPTNLSILERAFLLACCQGKIRTAWKLGQPLWESSSLWEHILHLSRQKDGNFLEPCFRILQKNESCFTWESRAAAICLACSLEKNKINSFVPYSIPPEIEESLVCWKANEGRRKRRELSIPMECLYWITERGRTSHQKSNLGKLYCSSWKDLEGSAFWNRVLEEFQPWASDGHKEVFWDTFFPDDIPDEWSLNDQQKSHGLGVLINQENPQFWKFAEKWFGDLKSKRIWLGTHSMRKIISEQKQFLVWNEVYSKEIQTTNWLLDPVKREFEVISSL